MLALNKNNIYKILKKKNIIKNKTQLLEYLHKAKNRFYLFSKDITNNISSKNNINPLLWQLGHVTFFYSNLILKNLYNCDNINKYHNIKNIDKFIEFYDSFLTPSENRKGEFLLKFDKISIYFNTIFDLLEKYINKKEKLDNIEIYLIMLGILHNEMHNEAFIFTKLNLINLLPQFLNYKIYKNNNKLIEKNIFIKYSNGTFIQGSNNNNRNYLVFDNEMPEFEKKIKRFKISKYPITEYQYLKFIINGGYKKKELWCSNGWKWKEKNNINLPLYWSKENEKFVKTINNKKISVETNLPVINISYYEAKAYCMWIGGRLPLEEEFEFCSTNEGLTEFPWGSYKKNIDNYCNLNYKSFIKPVNYFKLGDNNKGVSQLIGNVWEWCEEPIYPYDGFIIDPVYREMSYPFFGFKRICKGGCFAVPDYLIHPKYRNAQYPDCRIQFIGFRVCKDY